MGVIAEMQLLEVPQAVRSGDCSRVLLLLAPATDWGTVVGVMVGLGLRKGNGGPTMVQVARVVSGNSSISQLGGEVGINVGPSAIHDGLSVLRCVLETLGCATNGESAALQDAVDVVAAHFKVCDGAQAAELDSSDVVSLCCFLLGACRVIELYLDI